MKMRWIVAVFAVGVFVGTAISAAVGQKTMRPPEIQLRSPSTWTSAQQESLKQLVNDINSVNRMMYEQFKQGEQ